jgi:hypothetical protein
MNVLEIIGQIKALPANERAQVAKSVAEENRKDVLLSTHPPVKVGEVESWLVEPIQEPEKQNLIHCIHHRLNNRYIEPLLLIDRTEGGKFRSGFLKMAVACLLIEAMQQFHEGKQGTDRKSKEAFKRFFEREKKNNTGFRELAEDGNYDAFYDNIRCGIFHQAETKAGYRILWEGPLFDPLARTINADEFLEAVKCCLENYIDVLRKSRTNETPLKEALEKLRWVCRNCQPAY